MATLSSILWAGDRRMGAGERRRSEARRSRCGLAKHDGGHCVSMASSGPAGRGRGQEVGKRSPVPVDVEADRGGGTRTGAARTRRAPSDMESVRARAFLHGNEGALGQLGPGWDG